MKADGGREGTEKANTTRRENGRDREGETRRKEQRNRKVVRGEKQKW